MTEGWQLAIDFGTTTTVAAARRLGESDAKMLEIGGSCAVSSAVFVAESGAILAGPQVERHADSAPERVVHAKRLLVDADCDGSTLIDGEILRDVDLIAPVLRFVHEEACDRFGGAPPTQVVLTCPAAWSDIRRQRLCDAAATAGIENPLLIEEPIAAAANLLRRDPLANVPDGVNIAVYDFGGTVDVAILKRAGDAFTLVGPVDGTDALGGDTIDHQLLRPIIDELPPAEQAALLEPEATSDPESWVRTAHQLKRTMREAKEALLQRRVQMVRLPNPPLSIDEVELDETILRQHAGATISSAVGFLADFLERSGTESSELGAIFLVGGCSRLSLLQRAVGERFPGVPLPRGTDPKQTVALGAAEWQFADPASAEAPPSVTARSEPTDVPGAADPESAQVTAQPAPRRAVTFVGTAAPPPLSAGAGLKASLLAGSEVLKASIAAGSEAIRATRENRKAAVGSVADPHAEADSNLAARTASPTSVSTSAPSAGAVAEIRPETLPRDDARLGADIDATRAPAPTLTSRPPPPEPPTWHLSLADLVWPRRVAANVEIDRWLVGVGEWFVVSQPLLLARIVGPSGNGDTVTVHARCSGRLERVVAERGAMLDPRAWIADVAATALPYRQAIVPRRVTGLVLALARATKDVPDARQGVTVQIGRAVQRLEWAQTYLFPLPAGTHAVTVSYPGVGGYEGTAATAIKFAPDGVVTCAYELNGLRGSRARLRVVG